MSTLRVNEPISLSANDQFKAQYPKYLRWSALVAVVATFIAFLVSPNYVPNPYTLRQEEFEIVNLDDQEVIELPPPPVEAPPPPKVIEAAPDDEVTEDVEIADTLLDLDTALSQTAITYDTGADEGFVVSQDKPKLIYYHPPNYPQMARISQLEGTVMIKVLVGPDGQVKEAIVLQSVHPLLNRAAQEAAMRCKFEPGKQRGVPVKAWMGLPYNFRLN